MSKVSASLTHEERVLELVLDAPKANILDAAMIDGIVEALERHAPGDLRAIVFSGAGDHFSFGASVAEHTAPHAREMLARFHGMFRRLMELSIPTFAVARGQCLGGGLELASFTDAIFAAPTARFGQPEINLAVFPPMASVLLPWKVGGAVAVELCVSGRTISAEEALALRLVHSIDADPRARLERHLVDNFLDKSSVALRYAEQAARLGLARALREDLPALETSYLDGLMSTQDANEGLLAFLEKRKAKYAVQADGFRTIGSELR
ncbi:MAG: enoyl-CoA hydratase/isomerase family protein [Deltaproteobacteria bacterium]|nr:enoyl-CoA hydratase/isomerase family protein [Deltaproteobacteria bacterium]